MPQLMPLNWIFSSIMMIMIIMSGCFIYSEMCKDIMIPKMKDMKNLNYMWLW